MNYTDQILNFIKKAEEHNIIYKKCLKTFEKDSRLKEFYTNILKKNQRYIKSLFYALKVYMKYE